MYLFVIGQFHVSHSFPGPSWTAGPVQDLCHGKQHRAFCPTWYKQWELTEPRHNVAPPPQTVHYPIWTVANSIPSLLLARMAAVTAALLKSISSQVHNYWVFPKVQGICMENHYNLAKSRFCECLITLKCYLMTQFVRYISFNSYNCFIAITFCF